MGQKQFKVEKLERAIIDWETKIHQMRQRSNYVEGDEIGDHNREAWYLYSEANSREKYTITLRECATNGEEFTRKTYNSKKNYNKKEQIHHHRARMAFLAVLEDVLP